MNDPLRHTMRFCPSCAEPLARLSVLEDGGEKERLRCAACGWTHWNNPVPVLAAVVECSDQEGRILLARNAAWSNKMFALITGFMEAGETPEDGIARNGHDLPDDHYWGINQYPREHRGIASA